MGVSKAHGRASNKYNAKTYDRVGLLVPKGRRAELHSAAAIEGKSLNVYILDAVEEHEKRKTVPEKQT